MNKLTTRNSKNLIILDGAPFAPEVSAKVISHIFYRQTKWTPEIFSILEIENLNERENGANSNGLDFLFQHQDILQEMIGTSGIKTIVALGTRFFYQGAMYYQTLRFIRKAHPKKKWFYLLQTEEDIFRNPNIRVGVLITNQVKLKKQPFYSNVSASSN